MNTERINELAEQAGFENGHQDRNGNSLSNELEKFAELIVRECIFVVEDAGGIDKYYYTKTISKHFGVEIEY